MRPGAVLVAAMLALASPAARAEEARASFEGLYEGSQVEIAAALYLGGDGRFEYALSYGALDERAAGSWRVEDGGVVLDSDPVVAPRFVLLGDAPGRGRSFELALEVPEGLPSELFFAELVLSDGTTRARALNEGRWRIAVPRRKTAESVRVVFPLYQVDSGPIAVPPGAQALRLAFEPGELGKVAFAGEALRAEDGALVLERHGRVLRFRRADAERADEDY